MSKTPTVIQFLNQDSLHGDFSLSPYQEWKWLYFTPVPITSEVKSWTLVSWIQEIITIGYEKYLYRFHREEFWKYIHNASCLK